MKKTILIVLGLFMIFQLTNAQTVSSSNCFSNSFKGVCVISQFDNSGTNSQVADAAIQYVGKLDYKWSGTSLTKGADCSGFVQSLYRKYTGISIPRTAEEQAKAGTPVSRYELQPGDLVFFSNTYKKGVSHVGIYLGTGLYNQCTYIESPHTGAKVQYASLCIGNAAIDCQKSQVYGCYYGARRIG